MKLKDIGLNIPEPEYRALNHLSSSFFSNLSRNGSDIETVDDSKPSIRFGKLVDEIICGTHKPENYHLITDKDTGKCITACDIIFNKLKFNTPVGQIDDYKEQIEQIFNTIVIDYWSKRKSDWRVTKLLTEGLMYFDILFETVGKIMIPRILYNNAHRSSNLLLTHAFTKDIFKLNKDQEGMFQFQFVFNYLGYNMKGMLDWIKIDHKIKTIEPFDIKTGKNPVEDFESSFYFWRYDIQALLYTIICTFLVKRFYNNYKILPFKFIYTSRFDQRKVLIWQISMKHLSGAKNGFTKNGRYYKGVRQLIKDHEWYLANSYNVHHPKEIYEANGIIKLNPNIEL